MNALEFDAVTVRLAGRDILRSASFALREGEFVGMLGANGAGKTTLFRAALGLLPLASGAIRIFGRPATRGAGEVGYMPQNRGAVFTARLSGYSMIESAAMGRRYGFSRLDAATRREIDATLDVVGAQALARRPIGELSGGERQRLLLAQALLGRPKLLLLDEPLISLDPAHQHAVVEIVARLRRELKIAVLFSAHELNPLLNAIDRVLYLGQGAAVLGTVDEVVNSQTLSRLYGADVEVVRVRDRVFVMAGGVEVESEAHRHEGHSHSHDHAHG
ncbi:MAG: ATP-binding cassette domain-containing protein [Pseudomonadota bacterium]|nr:ATP-binding cassette domain-containing protein [Pseudomonadota bacterium]